MNIKSKIITMHIDIADRHAVYQEAPAKLVCGNPFQLVFTFDEEWDEFIDVPKKCKIKFWHKGRYEHIIIEFTGTVCSVPALFGVKSIEVGVFVENDISTTTGAVIECEKSIRCGESIGVLGADAIDNINKALKGEPGYTPQRGIDYFTPEDIQYVGHQLYGDIVSALSVAVSLQEIELSGGSLYG